MFDLFLFLFRTLLTGDYMPFLHSLILVSFLSYNFFLIQGKSERNACYKPIIDEILRLFPVPEWYVVMDNIPNNILKATTDDGGRKHWVTRVAGTINMAFKNTMFLLHCKKLQFYQN